ncbi:MAG: hypothetical protein WB643_13975 [Candidatus Bathyarchaeia archaeon]|jgi:hypothetical protein
MGISYRNHYDVFNITDRFSVVEFHMVAPSGTARDRIQNKDTGKKYPTELKTSSAISVA